MKKGGTRFWELDVAKGVAIILVVIYHVVYDLAHFAHGFINENAFFWRVIGDSAAFLFVFLAGISLIVSFEKNSDHLSSYDYLKTNVFRYALKLLFFGGLITLVTFWFDREQVVVFGVLHFLGVARVLGFFFAPFFAFNAVLGVGVFALGSLVASVTPSFSYLLWLGFTPVEFESVDYFPIIPWFGLYLIGMFFGSFFYRAGGRRFALPDLAAISLFRPLIFLGRHTLLIYLVHQPIVFFLLYLMGKV